MFKIRYYYHLCTRAFDNQADTHPLKNTFFVATRQTSMFLGFTKESSNMRSAINIPTGMHPHPFTCSFWPPIPTVPPGKCQRAIPRCFLPSGVKADLIQIRMRTFRQLFNLLFCRPSFLFLAVRLWQKSAEHVGDDP